MMQNKSPKSRLVALASGLLALVCLVVVPSVAGSRGESPFSQCPKKILLDHEIRKACEMQLSFNQVAAELHECACAIANQEVNRLSLIDFEVRDLYEVFSKRFNITEDPLKSAPILKGFVGRDFDWVRKLNADAIGDVAARKTDLSRFYGELVDYIANYPATGPASHTYTSEEGILNSALPLEKRKELAKAATMQACKRLTRPIETHGMTFKKVMAANMHIASQLIEDFPNLKSLLMVKSFCEFAAKVGYAY